VSSAPSAPCLLAAMPNNLACMSIFAGPWFCPLSMLEEVIGDMGRRCITFTSYARQADSSVVQHRAAEAALKIEGARVQALRAVDAMHEMAVAGRQLDDQARVCRVVGDSAKLLRDAIDTLMSIGGANAFAEKSPRQRRWREAHLATRHALPATDSALEIYGHALLGVKGSIGPMV